MQGRRFGITVVGVACVAAALGAGAALTGAAPPWLEALNARSEGLNREYGLGDQARRVSLGNPGAGWVEALNVRSDGMNRAYGLGRYARRPTRSAPVPDWRDALNARSDALNRHYGLGAYAAKGRS